MFVYLYLGCECASVCELRSDEDADVDVVIDATKRETERECVCERGREKGVAGTFSQLPEEEARSLAFFVGSFVDEPRERIVKERATTSRVGICDAQLTKGFSPGRRPPCFVRERNARAIRFSAAVVAVGVDKPFDL